MKSYHLAALAVAIASVGLIARTSQGALALVDDFSTDTVGSNINGAVAGNGSTWSFGVFQTTSPATGTVQNDPNGGGFKVLQMANGPLGQTVEGNAVIPLTAATSSTATLFYQVYAAQSPAQGVAVGMSNNTSISTLTNSSLPNWAVGYVTQELGGPTNGSPLENLVSHTSATGGSTNAPLLGPTVANPDVASKWYDVWIVFNVGSGTTAGNYNAYVASAADPGVNLGTVTGSAQRAAEVNGVGLAALVIESFNENTTAGNPQSVSDIANIYFDPSSDDHGVDPTGVPEPASLCLLGIGAAGLMARRRRATK